MYIISKVKVLAPVTEILLYVALLNYDWLTSVTTSVTKAGSTLSMTNVLKYSLNNVINKDVCFYFHHSQPAPSLSPCLSRAHPERWLILHEEPPLQPVPHAAVGALRVCWPLRTLAAFPPRTGWATQICWNGFCRSPNWWWWRSPRREAWGFAMNVKDAQPAASWGHPALKPTRRSLR